jgi:GGDEF domain-containing protein
MQNKHSQAPPPRLTQIIFRHTFTGAAIGYVVLHPASVIIYDRLGSGSVALLTSIISAFYLGHLWMALYFAAIGSIFGLIHGFNYYRTSILHERIKRLSITDELTGLYNRRFLTECLNREWQRSKRYDSSLSLVMIDVDHFKNYNDVHGHPAGDRLLYILANRLRATARKTDVVARYGGEEFVILMPNTPISMAVHLAERIRQFKIGSTFDLL